MGLSDYLYMYLCAVIVQQTIVTKGFFMGFVTQVRPQGFAVYIELYVSCFSLMPMRVV